MSPLEQLFGWLLIERGCVEEARLERAVAEQPGMNLFQVAAQLGIPRGVLEAAWLEAEARQRQAGRSRKRPPPGSASIASTQGTLSGQGTQAGGGAAPRSDADSPGLRSTLAHRPTSAEAGPEDRTHAESGRRRAAVASGEWIAGYRLEEQLAQGGMGAVYRAAHPKLGKQVALKVLLAGAAAGAGEQERFRIEAQATARLRHRNIVAVHDAGVDPSGRAYLVMDLIEGGSLRERIRREGPLPERDAAAIIAELAEAVYYAHTRQIVHRDLKPANVLLDGKGRPLLTDFGIAKRLDDVSGLTRDGQAVGTPAYMAPEQAAGRLTRIGPLTDVFGLGAILYEMLTGIPPLAHIEDVIQAMFAEPRPLRELRPELSRDAVTLCSICLEHEPAHRYPSALALAEDARRLVAGQPIAARPVGRLARLGRSLLRHRRRLAGAALVLLLAGGLAGAPALWQRRQAQRSAEALQRAEAAMQARGAALVREASAALDEVGEALRGLAGARLASAGEPSPAEAPDPAPLLEHGLARVAQAVTGIAGLDILEAALMAAGEAAEGEPPAGALEDAGRRCASALPRRRLLAQAAYLRGELHAARGEPAEADRARAEAYRLDSGGESGARAYLALGRSFAAGGQLRRALHVCEAVGERTGLSADLRAQALLGAGEAHAALGRRPEAVERLREALALNALGEAEQTRVAAKLQGLEALLGRATISLQVERGLRLRMPGEERDWLLLTGSGGLHLVRWTPQQGLECVQRERHALPLREAQLLRGYDEPLVAILAQAERKTRYQVLIYALRERRLERRLVHSLQLPARSQTRLADAGDWDGDGRDELLLTAVNGRTDQVTLIRDPHLLEPRLEPIFAEANSWARVAAFADLDGDGRHEAVIGTGPWRRYSLLALRSAGGRPESLGEIRVGLATWLQVRPGPGPTEVVALTDHASGHRAAFGERFREVRDGVLVLRREEGRLHIQPLREYPHRDVDRVYLRALAMAPRLVPGQPRSLAFVEQLGEPDRHEAEHLIIHLEDAEGRTGLLRMRWQHRLNALLCADLDGDEDEELVALGHFSRSNHLAEVLGLRQLAPTERARRPQRLGQRPADDPPPLLVAEDLLACGHADAAATLLREELAREELTPAARVATRRALAGALAAQGRLREARELCRAVATEAPETTRDLLLQAAAYAEEAGDVQAALDDLVQLESLHRLTPAEERDVWSRRRRLVPLAASRTVLRIGADALADADHPWEVHRPLRFRRGPAGLGVAYGHALAPEMALSLLHDGSPLRLQARFAVERTEWATLFEITLEERLAPGEVRTPDRIRISAGAAGGGNVDTWVRKIEVHCWFHEVSGSSLQFVEAFRPATHIEVDLRYQPSDGRVAVSFRSGDEREEASFVLPHALNAGDYLLRIGQPNAHETRAHRFGAARLEELRIDAPPGALRVAPARSGEPAALGRAHRWLAAGQPEEALRGYRPLFAAGDPELRREAAFYAAFALARLGRGEDAVQGLLELRRDDAEAFDALWRYELDACDDDDLRLLGRAFAAWSGQDPAALPQVGLELAQQGRWPEALLAFQAAGPAAQRRLAEPAGLAFYFCGAFARALELLAQAAPASQQAREFAGRAAFRLGDDLGALELWGPLEPARRAQLTAEIARATRLRRTLPR